MNEATFMIREIGEDPAGFRNLGLIDQRRLGRDRTQMKDASKVVRHFDEPLGHPDDAQVSPELPWS
jgi:hypothetical protein